ncbi:MAG: putative porin [Leptospiraceae bacterium]|nr:putative porin [Leptospiraceae bacterium]MCP5511078.1 putative porin [Leptospiraceae bacterium]
MNLFNKNFVTFFFLHIFLSFIPIRSESYLGLSSIRNGGEHIFETGNKFPNLSGIRGGSRITYNRNYNLYGINGGWKQNGYLLNFQIHGTGWYRRTSNSRDEDFYLGSISTEKGTKFSLNPLFLNDSAHTFSGSQNFADGHAKSVVNDQRFSVSGRYYPYSNSSSFSDGGFFFNSLFRYTYFKYYLYDVIQFIQRPFFIGPIGQGLSYSLSQSLLGGGGGYRHKFNNLSLEAELFLTLGFSKFRDFHVQRALNFIGNGIGSGFVFRLGGSYSLGDDYSLNLFYEGNRMYSHSNFTTRGGLSADDVISGQLGKYKNYLSTKEANMEFSVMKLFK